MLSRGDSSSLIPMLNQVCASLVLLIFIDLSSSTKLSILTLAIFALKFSYDARCIKDKITEGLSEQKNVN